MSQKRPFRFQPADGIERLGEVEVSRMSLMTQCIQDQNIQPLKMRPAFLGDPGNVGAVGQVADTKAKNLKSSVFKPDRQEGLSQNLKPNAWKNRSEVQLGDMSPRKRDGVLVECVGEDPPDHFLGRGFTIDWNRASEILRKKPGVVETEEMIHMIMSIGDGMNPAHLGAEKLNPHLGGRVDDQVPRRELEEDARAGPLVPGVVGVANLAVAAEDRDTRGCSASQENETASRLVRFRQTTISEEPHSREADTQG